MHLLILVGTAAVAASADWLRALLVPDLPGWAAAVLYFTLVKVTGDLVRGLASRRADATAFYADFLVELGLFAGLGLVAAVAIQVVGGLVGAYANPAVVAVLAHLGILILGGARR